MPAVSVEYLAIFRRTDAFCDSAAAFTRLLQVNSKIVVNGGTIGFEGKLTCTFEMTSGVVIGKDQRFFQLKLTWDGDPNVAPKELSLFLSLLREVRSVISNTGGEVETLRDDVSKHYAQKAYSLIHDIENLMRRLIANFMLLKVGIEWTDESLPSAVADVVRKRAAKGEEQSKKADPRDYLNILHTLDFIHLGNILFDAYSKKTTADLYVKLKDVKTVADVEALQEFVPQSNWTRYFAQIIKCDDTYLQDRWQKLYLLRCKVAHNALMNKQDFADIERLVGEVKPKLVDAIGKLPQVTVPSSEVESVAESAARNVNAAVGEFIACWQQMEAAIARRIVATDGNRHLLIHTARELHERSILDGWRSELYEWVRRLRNRIVHGPSPDVPAEEIQAATTEIRRLIACIEKESIIARLRDMTESERRSEMDLLVADSKNEITESEEFCNAQAMTNATFFGVDEYEIGDIEVGPDTCTFDITYGASGEQLEDRAFAGDRITGEAKAVVDFDGRITYQSITARVDYGKQDEDEFDPGDIDDDSGRGDEPA